MLFLLIDNPKFRKEENIFTSSGSSKFYLKHPKSINLKAQKSTIETKLSFNASKIKLISEPIPLEPMKSK